LSITTVPVPAGGTLTSGSHALVRPDTPRPAPLVSLWLRYGASTDSRAQSGARVWPWPQTVSIQPQLVFTTDADPGCDGGSPADGARVARQL